MHGSINLPGDFVINPAPDVYKLPQSLLRWRWLAIASDECPLGGPQLQGLGNVKEGNGSVNECGLPERIDVPVPHGGQCAFEGNLQTLPEIGVVVGMRLHSPLSAAQS